MNKVIAVLALSLTVVPVFPAVKPCEELKSEIVAKLDAKGVKNYHVDIVPAEDVKDKTVIGSCENGTKKITYTKDSGAPAAKATPQK